jgi:outer membrane receptor protein involved in Fe transport
LPGGGFERSPFPDNTIPANRIDPVGQNLINLYPLPNLPGIANNFLYNPTRTLSENEFDVRIDHTFSEKDNGFFRYSQAHDNIYQPGPLPTPAVGGVISGLSREPSYQAVLNEAHGFSPSTINTARFGWSRIDINSLDANAGQPLASEVGIPGSNVPGDAFTDGLPLIPITGAQALGSLGNLPAIVVSNNYQWDDDLTLIRGRHTLEVGGEFIRLQYNVFQTSNLRGTLNFTTAYSSNPASPAGTGLGLADLLLGKPISNSLQFLDGTRGMRQSDLAFYVQDNFKATDKLTLNLGLRYENYLGWPWTEVYNRAYTFVPPSGVAQVGTDGIPPSGVNGNNLNFMPRVGLAYRVASKTVLRAAYGIFYSSPQIAFATDITGNPPELINTGHTNNQFDFATAIPASAGFSRSGTVLGSALNAVDLNGHMPYTQQWNAAVQHQISPSTLLTIAYVGTAGTHLQAAMDINQAMPGITPVIERRPFPLFQTITQVQNVDTSRYNALQITGERRLARGLSFQLAYTYSHALDYASFNSSSGGLAFMDSYNHRLDYGNADFNVPSRFAGSATYLLPFRASGALRQAVEGWQVNAIVSLWDGIPFSVWSATNTLNIGSGAPFSSGGSRAELIGPGNGSLPPGERTVQQWFNTAAFTTPPPQQFGDAARNSLQGPATKQLDLSLFRNFPLGESKSLQFRAEFFNFFNTPQFNNPSYIIGAPGAGTITSAGSPYTFQRLSREIQMALKFYF